MHAGRQARAHQRDQHAHAGAALPPRRQPPLLLLPVQLRENSIPALARSVEVVQPHVCVNDKVCASSMSGPAWVGSGHLVCVWCWAPGARRGGTPLRMSRPAAAAPQPGPPPPLPPRASLDVATRRGGRRRGSHRRLLPLHRLQAQSELLQLGGKRDQRGSHARVPSRRLRRCVAPPVAAGAVAAEGECLKLPLQGGSLCMGGGGGRHTDGGWLVGRGG